MSDPEGPKYSLAIIARNCAEGLRTLLENYGQYPDEIVVVNTGIDDKEAGFDLTNAVADEFGAKVFHFPWIDDFAAARNFSFEKCSHPFVMWLDTDDVVENPQRCDENIRLALKNGVELIFMEYLYEFDKFGNCTTLQDRERVVRKDSFWWPDSCPIHECLCATKQVTPAYMPPNGGRVMHTRKMEDFESKRAAMRRNLRILQKHFGKDGRKPEIRMLYYWGNTLAGLGDHAGAAEKYREYIDRSAREGNGNEGEMMSARCNLAEMLMILGKMDEAELAVIPVIIARPDLPTGYLILTKLALDRRDFDKVVLYAKQTLDLTKNMKQQIVSSPRELVGRSHFMLAIASASLGRYDVAKQEVEEARKFFNGDPQFRQFAYEVQNVSEKNDTLHAWNAVRDRLIADGRKSELIHLAQFAPLSIADESDVQRFTPKNRPSGKKSIAFICVSPPGHVAWGPQSIKEGIGGSEEAVINASREFAKKGWHVEVYAHTGRPCKDGPLVQDGVHWYRTEAWAGAFDNPVDVAVAWRSAQIFKMSGVNARSKYVWLHDICNPAGWYSGVENDYDGFIMLSRFHRSLFKFLPEEKIVYAANGLDPDLLVPLEDLVNEPHRMIWGSDPSRGLQYLLPWWGKIREAVPDAELDVFYGWTPHFMAAMAGEPGLQGIYKQIEALKDQPGVHWHGKVGQDVLAKAYAKAGVLPYMTTFQEIHCITALKAQAHGVVPVCTDAFALKETVQFGEKLPGPMDDPANQARFIDRVIDNLKNPVSREKRLEMARWARAHTWASIVADWDVSFSARLQEAASTA